MIIFRPPPELKFKELNMVTGTKYDIDAEEKAQPPAYVLTSILSLYLSYILMRGNCFQRFKNPQDTLHRLPQPHDSNQLS